MKRLLIPMLMTGVLLCEAPASASVTGISVRSVRDLGTFAGKPYREAALQIRGTAPTGPYSVPAVVTYPLRASDANDAALVEPYNTVPYWFPDPRIPADPFTPARIVLSDEYVFGEGNVHIAVHWDEGAIEARGEGFMTAGSDGYQLLRDTAALVRSPGSAPYPPKFRRPPAASTVVATGYSGSSNFLRDFYLKGESEHGGMAFDGALLLAPNATCASPDAPVAFYHCPGVITDGGEVLVVNTEADAEFAGFTERGHTRHYRVQELAGIAHIPSSIFDLRQVGQPEQNPVSAGPAFRAAHTNLLRWMKGARAPESRYLRLQDTPPTDLAGFPYIPARRDADGNALGGIRLPHMPSRKHGRPAGAPLGTYTGLDLQDPNGLHFLAGTFHPFSQARLNDLYPRHAVYVDRVRRAANRLLAERHILRSDRDAYIESAKRDRPGSPGGAESR